MQSEPTFDVNQFQFIEILAEDELPIGERIVFEVNAFPIVLFNLGGSYYAMGDVCTHDQGPLGDGDLDGCQIICPRHGARFNIRTGEALGLPAVLPSPTYPVRVINGKIEVGIPK